MKKYIKFIFSIVVLTCLIGGIFNGCEGPQDPQQEICILMGNTKNTREANIGLFEDELIEAAKKISNVSVIVLDGKPDSCDFKTELDDSGNIFYSSQDRLREVEYNIILNYPVEEEVDILSGLESASAIVNSNAKDNKAKQILIYSSGISTCGILNFASESDLIYQKTDDIVTYVSNKLESIDLSDIDVIWYGLGDVTDNQTISELERKKLKDIWNAILEKCNAKSITFKKYVASSNSHNKESLEQFIKDNDIEVKLREDYPKVTPAEFKGYINLDESLLEFKPNDYEFVNTKKAETVLKDYAEVLSDFKGEKIYVIGCTADDGTDEACYRLSVKRANVVKDILCKYGMNESNLEVIGIGKYPIGGNNSKWRVDDSDKSNATQSLNRKVMLIMENSDEGKLFNKQWNEYKNKYLK